MLGCGVRPHAVILRHAAKNPARASVHFRTCHALWAYDHAAAANTVPYRLRDTSLPDIPMWVPRRLLACWSLRPGPAPLPFGSWSLFFLVRVI